MLKALLNIGRCDFSVNMNNFLNATLNDFFPLRLLLFCKADHLQTLFVICRSVTHGRKYCDVGRAKKYRKRVKIRLRIAESWYYAQLKLKPLKQFHLLNFVVLITMNFLKYKSLDRLTRSKILSDDGFR